MRVLPHAVAALPRLKELLLYSNHLRRTGLPEKIQAPLALLDLRFNTKLTGDVVREEISARCTTATTVLVSPRRAPLPPAGTVDCAATRDAETLEAQLPVDAARRDCRMSFPSDGPRRRARDHGVTGRVFARGLFAKDAFGGCGP